MEVKTINLISSRRSHLILGISKGFLGQRARSIGLPQLSKQFSETTGTHMAVVHPQPFVGEETIWLPAMLCLEPGFPLL